MSGIVRGLPSLRGSSRTVRGVGEIGAGLSVATVRYGGYTPV